MPAINFMGEKDATKFTVTIMIIFPNPAMLILASYQHIQQQLFNPDHALFNICHNSRFQIKFFNSRIYRKLNLTKTSQMQRRTAENDLMFGERFRNSLTRIHKPPIRIAV